MSTSKQMNALSRSYKYRERNDQIKSKEKEKHNLRDIYHQFSVEQVDKDYIEYSWVILIK